MFRLICFCKILLLFSSCVASQQYWSLLFLDETSIDSIRVHSENNDENKKQYISWKIKDESINKIEIELYIKNYNKKDEIIKLFGRDKGLSVVDNGNGEYFKLKIIKKRGRIEIANNIFVNDFELRSTNTGEDNDEYYDAMDNLEKDLITTVWSNIKKSTNCKASTLSFFQKNLENENDSLIVFMLDENSELKINKKITKKDNLEKNNKMESINKEFKYFINDISKKVNKVNDVINNNGNVFSFDNDSNDYSEVVQILYTNFDVQNIFRFIIDFDSLYEQKFESGDCNIIKDYYSGSLEILITLFNGIVSSGDDELKNYFNFLGVLISFYDSLLNIKENDWNDLDYYFYFIIKNNFSYDEAVERSEFIRLVEALKKLSNYDKFDENKKYSPISSRLVKAIPKDPAVIALPKNLLKHTKEFTSGVFSEQSNEKEICEMREEDIKKILEKKSRFRTNYTLDRSIAREADSNKPIESTPYVNTIIESEKNLEFLNKLTKLGLRKASIKLGRNSKFGQYLQRICKGDSINYDAEGYSLLQTTSLHKKLNNAKKYYFSSNEGLSSRDRRDEENDGCLLTPSRIVKLYLKNNCSGIKSKLRLEKKIDHEKKSLQKDLIRRYITNTKKFSVGNETTTNNNKGNNISNNDEFNVFLEDYSVYKECVDSVLNSNFCKNNTPHTFSSLQHLTSSYLPNLKDDKNTTSTSEGETYKEFLSKLWGVLVHETGGALGAFIASSVDKNDKKNHSKIDDVLKDKKNFEKVFAICKKNEKINNDVDSDEKYYPCKSFIDNNNINKKIESSDDHKLQSDAEKLVKSKNIKINKSKIIKKKKSNLNNLIKNEEGWMSWFRDKVNEKDVEIIGAYILICTLVGSFLSDGNELLGQIKNLKNTLSANQQGQLNQTVTILSELLQDLNISTTASNISINEIKNYIINRNLLTEKNLENIIRSQRGYFGAHTGLKIIPVNLFTSTLAIIANYSQSVPWIKDIDYTVENTDKFESLDLISGNPPPKLCELFLEHVVKQRYNRNSIYAPSRMSLSYFYDLFFKLFNSPYELQRAKLPYSEKDFWPLFSRYLFFGGALSAFYSSWGASPHTYDEVIDDRKKYALLRAVGTLTRTLAYNSVKEFGNCFTEDFYAAQFVRICIGLFDSPIAMWEKDQFQLKNIADLRHRLVGEALVKILSQEKITETDYVALKEMYGTDFMQYLVPDQKSLIKVPVPTSMKILHRATQIATPVFNYASTVCYCAKGWFETVFNPIKAAFSRNIGQTFFSAWIEKLRSSDIITRVLSEKGFKNFAILTNAYYQTLNKNLLCVDPATLAQGVVGCSKEWLTSPFIRWALIHADPALLTLVSAGDMAEGLLGDAANSYYGSKSTGNIIEGCKRLGLQIVENILMTEDDVNSDLAPFETFIDHLHHAIDFAETGTFVTISQHMQEIIEEQFKDKFEKREQMSEDSKEATNFKEYKNEFNDWFDDILAEKTITSNNTEPSTSSTDDQAHSSSSVIINIEPSTSSTDDQAHSSSSVGINIETSTSSTDDQASAESYNRIKKPSKTDNTDFFSVNCDASLENHTNKKSVELEDQQEYERIALLKQERQTINYNKAMYSLNAHLDYKEMQIKLLDKEIDKSLFPNLYTYRLQKIRNNYLRKINITDPDFWIGLPRNVFVMFMRGMIADIFTFPFFRFLGRRRNTCA